MISPSFSLTATERVLPSMALDFTTASLDSRVTFTRSGNTATVTNSSGYVVPINANLPRFDFDPIALTCKGLLIEESRTNYLFQSNRPDTSPWITFGTSVSFTLAAITAPDNTLTGVLANNTGTSPSLFYQIVPTATCGTGVQSCSVYAKKGASDIFTVNTYWDAEVEANVTFTLTGSGATNSPANSTITLVGNNWFRCVVIHPARTGVGLNFNYRVWPNGRGVSSATGTYFWGFQQEAGSFATSFIPTTVSQVTRTADVASMTGTNFSSWYNASEGAFVASAVIARQSSADATAIFSANDNTSANLINCFYRASGALGANIFASSISQLDQTQLGITAANVIVNTGVAYKLNDAVSYANATVQTSDTSVTVPTINQLQLGFTPTGAYLNGYVRNLRFYKQRILNAEGQAFSK
jgi:hypothetical protein